MTPHFTLNIKMKDFNNSFIQDPIIENLNSGGLDGKMFKFSSGYAVFVGTYSTTQSNTSAQGSITLSGIDDISIEDLGFTEVLGGSIAKNGFNTNTSVFGSSFEQAHIYLRLFRGDNYGMNGSIVSVIIFGLYR